MPRIDTSCDSGISTLETYYSNFIGRQLYAQKCLKYRKSQYLPAARQLEYSIHVHRYPV